MRSIVQAVVSLILTSWVLLSREKVFFFLFQGGMGFYPADFVRPAMNPEPSVAFASPIPSRVDLTGKKMCHY